MIYSIIMSTVIILIIIILLIVWAYLRQKWNNQVIQFIHIPKNAGTTIDKLLYKNHFIPFIPKFLNFKTLIFLNFNHQPLNTIAANSYHFSKTFCIIRNPYDHIISQFKCQRTGCKANWPIEKDILPFKLHPGKSLKHCNCTTYNLNKYIQEKLKCYQKKPSLTDYHFTPQFKYIWDQNNKRVCRFILRFENLDREFNTLMKRLNLNINLDSKRNKQNKGICQNLSQKDLYWSTKKLIQNIYKEDFIRLNYKM